MIEAVKDGNQAPGVTLRGALNELLQVAVPIPDFGRAVQLVRGI